MHHLHRFTALGLAFSLTLASSLPALAAPLATWEGPPDVYAITNAKIVPVSGSPIDKGTIVFRDGIIAAVGATVDIPADARVVDGTGLTVYPALINAYTRYGMPAPSDYPAARGDGYPVSTVRSENTARALLRPDTQTATAMHKLGFGAALAAPYVGIFSGSSAVISLGTTEENPANLVVRDPVAMQMAFFAPNAGSDNRGFGYPGSLMGRIAVARQALTDAQDAATLRKAYSENPSGRPRPFVPRALDSLVPVLEKQMPLIASATGASDIKRVLRLTGEFGVKPVIEGATEAYQVVDDLKKAGVPVLLSADLPQAPRLPQGEEDPTTLQGLRHRALAPTSAAKLAKAGVPFALTTSGMSRTEDFPKNVRTMIAAGLSEEQALVATTLTPAKILGVDRQLGSLEKGKIANVLVVEGGTLFDGRGKIKHLFIDGKEINLGNTNRGGRTGGPAGGPPANILSQLPPGVSREQAISFLEQNPDAAQQVLPAGVTVEQALSALRGETPSSGSGTPQNRTEEIKAPPAVGEGLVPPLPAALPGEFVLRDATVWTVSAKGIVKDADVHVKDGKIVAVGPNLNVPAGTREIDARGKHITPGMIDCHSHTAIDGGVNEGSNIVTAECRIEDVIDPEDVNIYRQLAGGTTAANLLHGSANAIGGQNAVVKWRWGMDADGLLLKGAPSGIKFALGENPTRSNGGIPTTGSRRYPATRMGVERVIRAKFMEAKDYRNQLIAYRQSKVPVPPRRDWQLEAVAEILEGKRLVHCHSYRADEILMMTRLADEFGFKIATFQHVLEGYKVADELAKHGAGGSTFSDWWGFKMEAYDAIPQNGSLMAERGVVASFNSDSSELARRMNLEASKAVRYGGMKPEEAIKLVTINPAKQLGVEKMVGSLEPGKDADIAVWSGDPLSTLTICEKTFVDGKLYFDREADLKARAGLEAEKKRLQTALNPAPRRPSGNRPGGNRPNPNAAPTEDKEPPVKGGPRIGAVKETIAPPKVSGPITAFVGATVHPVSGPAIPNGVVLVQGGKITAVGAAGSVSVPGNAKKVDLKGQHIYPGLIDADTTIGVNEIGSRRETQDYREIGEFQPELMVALAINPDANTLEVARTAGILNAVVCPAGGVISGMGSLIQLDGWSYEDFAIVPRVGAYINFPTLGFRRFGETAHRCEETAGEADHEAESLPMFRSGAFIPASSLDARALRYGLLPEPQPPAREGGSEGENDRDREEAALRPLNNFFKDARDYKKAKEAQGKPGVPPLVRDPRHEAMIPVLEGKVPLFVRADRKRDITAAVNWAKTEGYKMVLIGGQEADECTELLAKEKVPVILGPVMNLPRRFDLPYDDSYTLPSRLAKAGVTFCLSTGGAQDVRRLPQHAAMAASYGLNPDEALKAITLYPAQILGVGDRLGSIEVGKDANFLITTGNPLETVSGIKAAYIAGQPVDLSNKQTRLYDKWRSRPRK
ncbi:MAG: hypothetical protein OHK0029_05170 [Armatimonadaceae bacterium]